MQKNFCEQFAAGGGQRTRFAVVQAEKMWYTFPYKL